ncbi:MAG: hypothetical protein D6731_15875 [Planctomycetota bacterium]|nr:MAG: hypothetical protein D6731_15875 [Planctomycetota bacterium]
MRGARSRAACSLLLLCGALGATGCPSAEAPSSEPAHAAEAAPAPLRWELERRFGDGGPVRYTIKLARTRFDLSQDLWVEEVLDFDRACEAALPDIVPGDLDGLRLARVVDLPGEQGPKRRVLRRRLLLEPEHTGTLRLAERWIFFTQPGAEGSTEGALRSEALTVAVDPLPENVEASVPPPEGIFRADPSPAPPTRWPWLFAALPALVALVALLRRRRHVFAPPRPAHEVALEALSRLDALGLLERGNLDGYFVTLSAILRDYIGRRFGIRAPAQTTQEFLRAAQDAPALLAYRATLASFLEQADAVKFAAQRLPIEAAQRARAEVEAFVRTTGALESAKGQALEPAAAEVSP